MGKQDKDITIQDLEKKIKKLQNKNATLLADNNLMRAQMRDFKRMTRGERERILELESENRNLKLWISNMENSTSWKMTKPVRKIVDKIKGI